MSLPASAIRLQIEAALASRIPSALTPAPRILRPVRSTGIAAVDTLLDGGFPVGAITELSGPECSGITSLAISFIAGIARSGSVAGWIDISDSFDPESAATAGVDLDRLLWVRCGASAQQQSPVTYRFVLPEKYLQGASPTKGLHGGGCGGHPRGEVKGLAQAVGGLLRPDSVASRCVERQGRARTEPHIFMPPPQIAASKTRLGIPSSKPWGLMERALRVTDLLLQTGGFSAVVLDLGGIAPEFASRVPLATWFRYKAAAERTQVSLLLLTRHPCAKNSSELSLRFDEGHTRNNEATVFTGMEHHVTVERRRFTSDNSNVVNIRKPPQSEMCARWRTQTPWAGAR